MRKLFFILCCVPALAFASDRTSNDDLAYYSGYENNPCTQDACGRRGCLCDPWEFFITADFLYWRPFQSGMEYAVAYTPFIDSTGALVNLPDARSIEVDFEWEPGFRVGIGTYNCECLFDAHLYYTRLRAEEKTSASGNLFPSLYYQGDFNTSANLVMNASADWDIHFQNLDLDVGYYCCCKPCLIFHPFLGLKGAWICQDVCVTYSNIVMGTTIIPGTTFIDIKNDYWGVGPKIGFGVQWYSLPCLYLFGNASGAILYGEFNNRQRHVQVGQVNPGPNIDLKDKFDLVCPTAQIQLGVGYDNRVDWCGCCFNLGLELSAEGQYWWAQNQIQRFTSVGTQTHLIPEADLAFFGLTLSGWVGF